MQKLILDIGLDLYQLAIWQQSKPKMKVGIIGCGALARCFWLVDLSIISRNKVRYKSLVNLQSGLQYAFTF
jgi:hypothetical protein